MIDPAVGGIIGAPFYKIVTSDAFHRPSFPDHIDFPNPFRRSAGNLCRTLTVAKEADAFNH